MKLIFLLTAFVSTLYWFVLFVKLSRHKEQLRYDKKQKPSIVISAKNAAPTLRQTLPKLLSQIDITQIVIANDYSKDDSATLLKTASEQNTLLETFTPSKDLPGKKLALTEAIEKATSKVILLTDADCVPASKQWAKLMSQKISSENSLVLGYGPMKKEAGLINLFSRFETIITAIQYFSFALFNLPYMGVGRNLAFSKTLFKAVGGYKSHEDLPSGDDDLFVQEAASLAEVKICLDPKSFMYSASEKNLSDYINQKRRHIGTSSRYSFKHQFLLSIHPFCHIIFYSLVFLLIAKGNLLFSASVLFARWLSLILLGFIPFKRLDGKDLIILFPFFDVCLYAYYLFFGLNMFRGKKSSWK